MKIKIAVIVLAAASLLTGITHAQQSTSSLLALMKSIVIPQSDIVFAVGNAAPRNEKEWAAVQQAASRLTEAANTLSAQAPTTNGANWLKFSQAISEAAGRSGTAAKSKNVDAVLNAGDVLYKTCEDCHKQYMKK
ncbi:MAG TPA: hypothetical protein VK663_14295 [Burkholderiales bacterium]|nr:hypothetical protein [Burkholderiales bacterium]